MEQNGQQIVTHSTQITKRYRDRKTGEWKNSDVLFPDDIPDLILVASKTYECLKLKEEDNSDAVNFPPEPAEDADAPVEEEPATEA